MLASRVRYTVTPSHEKNAGLLARNAERRKHRRERFAREVGCDEMHRRRQRDAALPDALKLERLGRRMVYFKNLQRLGKSRAAERKTVETRTDQHILPYSPVRCRLQRIFRIARAQDDAGVGNLCQKEIVQE